MRKQWKVSVMQAVVPIRFHFGPHQPFVSSSSSSRSILPNIIISDLAKLVDLFDLLICTSRVSSVFHQRRLVRKFNEKNNKKKGKSRTAELEKTPLQYRGMR